MTIRNPAPQARNPVLDRFRELKMARSVHTFVRGAVDDFYQWLDESPIAIPELPASWICGDCHLGNLGPVANAKGRVDVEIRDLDHTVIGNPAHDLLRLGLSLVTAARSSVLPGVATAEIVDALARGYRHGLMHRDPPREPDAVRIIRKRAFGRHWRDLVKERARGREDKLPRGTKFWDLTDEEFDATRRMLERPGVHAQAMTLTRSGIDDIRIVDAAYWRKGCSSVGKLRIAILLGLADKAAGRDLRALVDVKEAVRPAAPAVCCFDGDDAARVATGARALAPNLGDRMIATSLLDRPVVVRELKPQDLKLEIDQFSTRQGIKAAEYLGHRVARAHRRQMTSEDCAEIRDAFNAGSGSEAPDWFWRGIVYLASRSEAAYLAHCRQIEFRSDP